VSEEPEAPGGVEPDEGGEDLAATESPGDESSPRGAVSNGAERNRRQLGVGIGVLAILLVLLASLTISRCDRGAVSGTEELTSEGTDGVDGRDPRADQSVIEGRVLRELPITEDAEAAVEAPAKPSAESLADPEIAELLEAIPAWKLEPPGDRGCRVRAWQGGELVGSEVGCDAEGRYELSLAPGVGGQVHVELLIEGHLRGLIEVEVPEDQAARVVGPTVALGPGLSVSGQTLDARGEPIAGVRVQALPQPTLGEPIPWRTVSDAEGRFEFTTLPYGPVSLRAIKPGYALSVVEALSPEDAVLMILDELIDLEGSVIADAELLARAKVRLEGSSVWPAIEEPLAEDGSFVIRSLPDGIYGVEVTVPADEPGGQEYASVPLENVTPDLRVSLALVPAFRVPVRVVDPEGEPVDGARVTLSYSQIGMLQKTAETDAEGKARLGPVVPGPYYVQADADGFLPPEPVEVEVGPEGFEGDEQVLVLIRPAKIEGIVVDENDRPVAGAEVLLDSEVAFSVGEGDTRRQLFAVAIGASEGSLGVTRGDVPDIPLFPEDEDAGSIGGVLTDEDGRFEIDLLLPGTHRIWAIHGEHAASAVSTFELRSGEVRTKVRLQLREGVPLTGVVRTANGQPIAGVQVDLGDGMILTTDDRGVFDAGFRRGRQELILRGPGMIPKAVEVDLGDEPLDLELELEPAEGRFEGRVVDGNDQPIADVEIELHPKDGLSPSRITWTDERGLYELDELAPGKVELEFRHHEYVPGTAEAEVDEAGGLDHEFVLDKGWTASVLVRSAVRGEPLAGVELSTEDAAATTDKEGLASLTRLVGDEVTMQVRAEGWVGQQVELRHDGSGHVSVTVELAEGGSISGTIDDDIGESVAGAKIEIRSPGGKLLGETRSNGRGEWRVDSIREGDVVVRAEPPPASSAVLAPTEERSDVLRREVTQAVRLRFERR
jgi:protocatechuate 3,4-dioxygenase beta subunit